MIEPVAEGGKEKAAEVHIWFTQLDQVNPASMERYKTWFTSAEQSQFLNFRSERRCREFIVGRGLARWALAHEFGVSPESFEFATGPQGKLSIDRPEFARDVHFNISHTADRVVCGTCRGFGIGLDVELIATRVDPLLIAKRFFSESESNALLALSDFERLAQFFSLWTLKEAFAKAHGIGLLAPIDTCRFDMAGDGSFQVTSTDASLAQGAWLASAALSPKHRLSVCVLCDDTTKVHIVVHPGPSEPVDTVGNLRWTEGRLQKPGIET